MRTPLRNDNTEHKAAQICSSLRCGKLDRIDSINAPLYDSAS